MQTASTTVATQHSQASAHAHARVERVEVLVIGGGQAGLAAAQRLLARDIEVVVLSADARTGDTWRNRWDSLRLFTPARYCGLPDMPFPAPGAHLADKDEVADYLERYAERFDIPIRLGTTVTSLGFDGRRYVAVAAPHGRVFEADRVIVATGAMSRPIIPVVAQDLASTIQQRHSSQYRHAFDLQDGPVLVVGAGNSGAQIALELARDRKVWLAGRETGHWPRRLLGRDLFDWLWPMLTRGTPETLVGKGFLAFGRRGGFPLIGIPERTIREAGITRVPRLEGVRNGAPVCGSLTLRPRVVIWSTGFRSDFSWIHLPVIADNGMPLHTRGVVDAMPGLYFTGMPFQHTKSSSLLGGVGADAEYVARHIAERIGA